MSLSATANRSNDEWLESLRAVDVDGNTAIGQLHSYLHRLLGRMLSGRLPACELEDVVQESLMAVIRKLETFRGDSKFLTWAAAVATHVAFTELRKRTVRKQVRDAFAEVQQDIAQLACPRTPEPSDQIARADIVRALHVAIATTLTERQRTAVMAELRGVPSVEVAARLGTNQNALYKLVHDARMKLRQALEAGGFGGDSLRAVAARETP